MNAKSQQQSKLGYVLPVCFVLFGTGLVSCSQSAQLGFRAMNISASYGNVTPISEVQNNPTTNATIYLRGQVTNRAPFLVNGAYKLQDATGTIWIVTNQSVPNVGDEVVIKGQVQFQSIPLAEQEFGEVYVQEQEQVERISRQELRQPVLPAGS